MAPRLAMKMDPHAKAGAMRDFRSKTFIVGVLLVALVIVLLTSTVITLTFARGPDEDGQSGKGRSDQDKPTSDCWPQRSFPKRDLSRLRNVAASDNSSMATLAAYIQMFDSNHAGFIPLELESMSFGSGPTENYIILGTDCAELRIIYWRGNNKVRFAGLKWFLNDELHAADMPAVCEFAPTVFDHSFPLENRFSCLGRLAYHCIVDSYDGGGNRYRKPVAQIVFDVLEVELIGASDVIKQGLFSKEPALGGCGL